jgi:cytosine/adenosine deaminase-related metal-dependent hydrolase
MRQITRITGCGLVALVVACGSSKGGPGAQAQGDDGGAPVGTSLDDAAGCYLVLQGTAPGLAIKSTLLVPGGPLDGEMLIDSTGQITCVAASCSGASGYEGVTQVACSSAVVAPGFVNAHDHTTYDFTPPSSDAHGTTRYQHRNEWRTGADGMTALPEMPATSDAKMLAAIELRFVMSGVTSIVSSGGSPGLARNLAAYNDTSWLEGLTGKVVYFDTFPLGDENGTILTSGCNYPGVISKSSAFEDGVFAPHFAEGINPGAENELVCANSTAMGLLTNNTAVLHAVGTNARDVAAIQAAGASVVWAPRSNISLYGNTMPVTEMKYAGVPIALGTDWLPSGSMNMLRELACAEELDTKYFASTFSDEDLVDMATSVGAKEMGFGNQIGTIAVGMQADVVVFATTGAKDYSVPINASPEDVALVLRGGTALYGDQLLVQAAGGPSTCATMTMCGVDKSVCLDVPGVALSDIQSSAASSYPLYFCRGQIPTGEPTCTPYRDSYPNGSSATDQDGDGVPDAMDDCPTIFNPARSMDNNVQSDLDGDGFGDACDAKPLDPSGH